MFYLESRVSPGHRWHIRAQSPETSENLRDNDEILIKKSRNGVDCSYPMGRVGDLKPLTAFQCAPVRVSHVLRVDDGASVDCQQLDGYIPHCHGTHTETVLHICPASMLSQHQSKSTENQPMDSLAPATDPLMPCLVLTHLRPVRAEISTDPQLPHQHPSDWIVDSQTIRHAITEQWSAHLLRYPDCHPREIQAIMLWVCADQANDDTNAPPPPYLTPEAVSVMFEHFPELRHLLVNLPSVDREQDGGRLFAHWLFFSGGHLTPTLRTSLNSHSESSHELLDEKRLLGSKISPTCFGMSITEFCYWRHRTDLLVLEPVMLLQLHVLGWSMDANPSRPVLHFAEYQ